VVQIECFVFRLFLFFYVKGSRFHYL
jgi:hypothetical protein